MDDSFFEQLNPGIEPRFRTGHPEPRLLHMKHSPPSRPDAATEPHTRPRTSRVIDGIADGR